MATAIFNGGATRCVCAGTFHVYHSEVPASVWASGMCAADCIMVLQRTNCTTVACTGVTQYAADCVIDLWSTGWNTRPIPLPGIYKINKPCASACNVQVFLSKGNLPEDI